MNKKASLFLKGVAIFIVMLSHYYRYIAVTSWAHFLYHFGFLGAALFAFVSGYGVYVSYGRKGFYKGWLRSKLKKVYLPFVVVNLCTELLLYPARMQSLRGYVDILTGSNDPILWYVPFILFFYLLFYILFHAFKSKSRAIVFLIGIFIVYIFVCEYIGRIGSPWYTSVGSLALGVIFGYFNIEKYQQKNLFAALLIMIIAMSTNMLFRNLSFVKDWTTIISAGAFCVCLFYLMLIRSGKEPQIYNRIVVQSSLFLGNISYWIYITHMKILHVAYGVFEIPKSIILFLMIVIICGYTFKYVYGHIEEQILKVESSEK